MTLALVTGHDATLVPAPAVPGIRSLGWSDTPPEGLTDQDLDRIATAVAAGRAQSTRRTYAWQWGRFEQWCAGRGLVAMPATPATVCAYLTDFAAQGVAAGTVECACAAIAAAHETEGEPSPIADQSVRAVRRGLRRILGTAPRRQSRPLSTDEDRRMVEHIDRTTGRGARDAGIILLGFASALRRSELAGLDLDDIEPKPEGLLIRAASPRPTPSLAAKSSASPTGGIPRPTPSPRLTPGSPTAAASAASSSRASTTTASDPVPSPGAAWPACSRNAQPPRTSPTNGLAATPCAPATPPPAAMAGVGLDRIAAQTRDTRISTLVEHYIRPLEAMQVTSSRDLGL